MPGSAAPEDGAPAESVPPGPAPADTTVATFHYPSIGGGALGFVVFVLTMASVGIALQPLGTGSSAVVDTFLGTTPGELLGIVAALAAAGWPLRRLRRQLAIPRAALPSMAMLYFGGMAFDVGVMLLDPTDYALPTEFEELLRALTAADDPAPIVLVFLMLVVVGPVVEELLMRGILLRALAVNWGPIAGVLVSAVTFALLHGNRGQITYAFVPGIVFALVVLRTGSLGVSMVLHALINLTVFAILLGVGLAAVDPNAQLPSPPPAVAIIAVLTGATLLVVGVRRLPVDMPRLAFLWGVPEAAVGSARELCRVVRAIRRVPAVAAAAPARVAMPTPDTAEAPSRVASGQRWCRACGERMSLDVAECWFCGAPLSTAPLD